jgi:hypothetical protein
MVDLATCLGLLYTFTNAFRFPDSLSGLSLHLAASVHFAAFQDADFTRLQRCNNCVFIDRLL